jgi:hypothetical protein
MSLSPEKPVAYRIDDLRARFPVFVYEKFSWEAAGDELKLRYLFKTGPDIIFEPETTIQLGSQSSISVIEPAVLQRMVFHLGLIEMLSYWKATCAPSIVVRAGHLTDDQVGWWKDLLLNGMAEFFFVNQIDYRGDDFVRITSELEGDDSTRYEAIMPERVLLLASGGKDSALTLQLLKKGEIQFNCLMLNPLSSANMLVEAAGCEWPIVVSRKIDPRLFELNKLGFLNGHTPFSAYLAFLGVTCAALFGYSSVVVSNERSSNEGNVLFLGREVNHQYSKSVEFEKKFRRYSGSYLASNIDFFSMLRPLYEIQIIELVSRYPESLKIFKSCNRNQVEGTWCGRCPKCISMFTLFYPFMTEEQLKSTFGRNFFESEESVGVLKQLVGEDDHKPFECVGTRDETVAALHLALDRARRESLKLPLALQYVEKEVLPRFPNAAEISKDVLNGWSADHCLPQVYEEILKAQL